mmetsp:Transcript_45265/g.75514  ORF Transcript_45265/g.75514 Transcript_45265/m.75514 type:complete len:104 (-) Transcript_45265:315-626(-)
MFGFRSEMSGGFPYGGFDDGVDRSSFADKSAAAQRREDDAKSKYDELKIASEKGGVNVTTELLKPAAHLTSSCWLSFNKYVKSHTAWSAKRRQASEEEKRASG